MRRVGIVGYGHIGQFLFRFIRDNGKKHGIEVAFVWNRSFEKLKGSEVPDELIVENLDDIGTMSPDLIVEVAHPTICKSKGEFFLSLADFMMGSPSILSDHEVEASLTNAAKQYGHGLYVPAGAMWGSIDIHKMATVGVLKGLKITMAKHPSSFKLVGPVKEKNDQVLANMDKSSEPVLLYEGPVRKVCQIAPVNVNTMAVACISAHNLGFDSVIGRIVSDPNLKNWHVIDVEVTGLTDEIGNTFTTHTVRRNPAAPGAVTGKTTLTSICSSVILARDRGAGVHLC